MKSFFLQIFQDNLQFTPAHGVHGNLIIIHLVEVNPVDYAVTSIIGPGLRYRETTIAFAKIINHKLKSQNSQKVLLYPQKSNERA